MVIWSLQVAIRGQYPLTAYKTQLKNAGIVLTRHRGVAFFRWFNP